MSAQTTPIHGKARLPLAGKLEFRCFAEELRSVIPLLAPPSSSAAQARYGAEHVVSRCGDILVLRSSRYQRYVLTAAVCPEGCCGIGVLEVRLAQHKRTPPCIETIFVLPWMRRQGVALQLLRSAQADFPSLTVDGHLTADGAAFFGYRPKQAPHQLQALASYRDCQAVSALRSPDQPANVK